MASQNDTTQVTVGTSPTLILAARSGRASATISNHGTTDVLIGKYNVSTSTGALLPGVKGAAYDVFGSGAVYGIVATGSQLVSAIEFFG